MKIKINFFSVDFIKTIGAGIYKASVMKPGGDSAPLYIGESVFVLVRCATYLFKLMRNPAYLGFSQEYIENDQITLRFDVLEQIADNQDRKHREKEIIYETLNAQQNICQSGIGDRMKSIDDKIKSTAFLASK